MACVLGYVLAIATSCKKDEPDDSTLETKLYANGVFVVNEGPFQSGTGTITFYDKDSNSVEQDIFQTVNDVPLGNVAQSMSIFNDKAYIVVNMAAKVEVVNVTTFESLATIDGLTSPRYFLGLNSSKAYVSDWGSNGGNVAVINLSTNTVSSTIDVKGAGPESMVVAENKLFVINSGAWGADSTVAVIDTEADTLLAVITVGDNPKGIQVDANGNIWILCGGVYDFYNSANDTKGKLVQLDATDYTILQTIDFSTTDFHPSDLVMNGDKNKLYYIYGSGVYEFEITSTTLSTIALFSGNFYALGFDPTSHYLYAADPIDYTQNGVVYRYKENGDLVDSFTAGVIPTDFWFK